MGDYFVIGCPCEQSKRDCGSFYVLFMTYWCVLFYLSKYICG